MIEAGRPSAEIPDLYPAGVDFSVPPTGRTLIRGGAVLSLDPELGDLDQGDVLVEDEQILAVGPDYLERRGRVIDASGMIVMPGFVDSHRHIWEGLLRNIGTDVPLEGRTSYISFVLQARPGVPAEDAYVGNLVSRSARSTWGSRRSWTGRTSRARLPTPTR